MSDYLFTFNGSTFAPDGKVPAPVDVDAHNRAVEARELETWRAQPDHHVGYYAIQSTPEDTARVRASWAYLLRACPGVTVSTWLGTALGHGLVTGAHTNNFGARIIRIRILGTNGAEYWGAAGYDAELVRLHRVKARKEQTDAHD